MSVYEAAAKIIERNAVASITPTPGSDLDQILTWLDGFPPSPTNDPPKRVATK